jgi:hypothetical protein
VAGPAQGPHLGLQQVSRGGRGGGVGGVCLWGREGRRIWDELNEAGPQFASV